MQGLDEYIRQGEPQEQERGRAWQTAIGLQEVDGLKTSPYLLETARKHIEGDITIIEAKQLIDSYYKSQTGRKEVEGERTEEADKVSARITELLQEQTFNFSPAQLTSIHRRLFEGIYKFAGRIRDYNITKQEWVLRGETVYYASADTISETLEYDMGQERNFSYEGKSIDEAISHLTRFCANLWQIHAFGEGNTRSTAVFMIKYLKTLGFKVTNDLFATHSWYFRNALVRANYSNLQEGITETTIFLERFFRNMLLGETTPLRNREMHLDWKPEPDAQSAKVDSQSANSALRNDNSAFSLPPKCKNCTLEEIAVLRVIQQNPSATQKFIAIEIGKSERTVKSITARLQEQGILKRVNGKRNGYWEILGNLKR
ncbi:Fic family protein [Prevotella sp. RM4]|uniref:Fic family protein n=1 Tax=Prevotella sp. RM4 TaxID=1200547 RepID=UPI00051BFEB5|nr:Fic family protein [Prevotella sp. RM4]